jgi:flavorubredoxin
MQSFKARQISKNVYWVGAIDWSLRDFHGYGTPRGTTYNAFLITGDKPVLIDTVKKPFYKEMMARIASIIDPATIECVISNHAEMDHSGCLPDVIRDINPEVIYASKMGKQALQAHFGIGESITVLDNLQEFSVGEHKFSSLESRMLHWPDSMVTFYENDGILFTQDGFGMHYATLNLFVDENPKHIVEQEAAKYYANILLPMSNLVQKLIKTMREVALPIEMIAPDHGPIFRTEEDKNWILNKWDEWSTPSYYKKAVLCYDTMWNSTASMAAAVAEGIHSKGVPVEIYPMSGAHRSDVATALLEAGAFVVGSPTINKQMFPTIADTLSYVSGIKPTCLVGGAFGSCGWSPEGVKKVSRVLEEIGVELVSDTQTHQFVPDNESLAKFIQFGESIGDALLEKLASSK